MWHSFSVARFQLIERRHQDIECEWMGRDSIKKAENDHQTLYMVYITVPVTRFIEISQFHKMSFNLTVKPNQNKFGKKPL